ncbi:hypothetical protein M378DRAFT_301779 [Amanita muscaria Koide BX008]|uniref:F-box domain-containing protein n=1 Tax=Amanita muscaria (strain Koide BX008) TaxID=946122 RepID=A0A0C2WZS6_AMAMK|nr:hypothetical protein M378DRAFT_301779 [Amanita muscaria Koide BX008]
MLNNASSSLSPSGYYDARLRRRKLYRAAKKKGGRKHAERKSFKNRHFPFHCLPREISAEIFVLCLPDSEDPIKSRNAAPILLCNVSSSWRSLALSIPRLWNELAIRIADPTVDLDLATTMADSWIARSGELPLTLCLYTSSRNEKGTAMAKAHLNTFFRYASRWESVDISLFGLSPVSFPNLKFGLTPLLRKFSYSTSCLVSVPFPFTSCPLLSTITWPFPCFVASNVDPDIPWHQLTRINLEHKMSTHQTLSILQTCQKLVELNVSVDDDPSLDGVRSRRKPVENRSLRSFHIIYVHITCYCSGLLQSLTLPALTDFSLDTYFDSLSSISSRSVHTQLLRLFTRSKCKLEKLRLGGCGFDDASILKCLKHDSCSSLTELEISNVFNRPMFTDRVILALGFNNVLLPNLSRLSLEMCLSASPGVFGLMILTRCLWWDKGDQLKSLSLTVRDELEDIDGAFLKIANKSGLDVEITIDRYNDSDVAEDLYDTDS